ncbi:MAG: hypothetical protein ACYC6L_03035, partial [Anaerolineae bacterium]
AAGAIEAEGEVQLQKWTESLANGAMTPRQVQRAGALWLEWQRGRVQSLGQVHPGIALAQAIEALLVCDAHLKHLLANYPAQPADTSAAQEPANLVITRKGLGMPVCQVRVPRDERLAENYEQALNWADGRRSLGQIAALTIPAASPDEERAWLVRFARYCRVMAKYGYLEITEGV